MSLSGLPPVGPGALPAELRDAPAARRQEYVAALGFERQLVAQLAKGLTPTLEQGAGPRGDLVSGAFADAVLQGGGLGIARELDRALHPTPAPAAEEPTR